MTEFDHIEDEIDSIDDRVKMEYGDNYDKLSDDDKETVILDWFFHGQRKYKSSATKLRIGLDSYKNNEIENGDRVTKITYKNGKSHYQIRQADGKFGRWVK